jgi:anti-sigma B factor antagonist
MLVNILTSDGVTEAVMKEPSLTAANAIAFKSEMTALIEAGQMQIILDLNGVRFIDSTGLGALVGLLKRIGSRGDLVLHGLQPTVLSAFRLTRMDRVFRIFSDAQTAREAVAG